MWETLTHSLVYQSTKNNMCILDCIDLGVSSGIAAWILLKPVVCLLRLCKYLKGPSNGGIIRQHFWTTILSYLQKIFVILSEGLSETDFFAKSERNTEVKG